MTVINAKRTVRRIKHGEDGKPGVDGLPGPMGERGRGYYPAGIWNANEFYKCTTQMAQFVYYEPGKSYYILNKEGSFKGINPAEDYTANGANATWIYFENYKAVFVEILFAKFAMLGSAVFYEDFMFSQQGRDSAGNSTNNYQGFNPKNPEYGEFQPNIWLDFLKGKSFFRDTEVEGTIKADSGRIGNFNISNGVLENTISFPISEWISGYVGSLIELGHFQATYSEKLKFNRWDVNVIPTTEAIMEIIVGMGNSKAVSLKGLGTDTELLELVGGHISGFALKSRQVTSSTTLTPSDCFVSCYNTSTIAIHLPASKVKGKVYQIAKTKAGNITVNGNGSKIQNGSGTADTYNHSTYGVVSFIWDDTSWIKF